MFLIGPSASTTSELSGVAMRVAMRTSGSPWSTCIWCWC